MKISNEELTKELIKSQLKNELTPGLAGLLFALVNQQVDRPHYHRSIDHNELKAVALDQLAKHWRSCSLARTDNPFAYFVLVIRGAITHYIATRRLVKSRYR